MRVCGARAKRTGKEYITTIMVPFIKAISLMEKRTAMELSPFPIKPKFKHIGSRPISKDRGRCSIQMATISKETTIFLRRKGRDCIFGKMLNTRASSRRI
jgi:hypothetical protein